MRTLIRVIIILIFTCTAASAALTESNGLITDSVTSLMWRKGFITSATWSEANTAASADGSGGYADWRLPTRSELLNLVEPLYTPQIDPIFGLGAYGIQDWTFWSSDADPDADDYVPALQDRHLLVFFGDGTWLSSSDRSRFAARFVRALGPTNGILNETAGYILTETGDYLLQE